MMRAFIKNIVSTLPAVLMLVAYSTVNANHPFTAMTGSLTNQVVADAGEGIGTDTTQFVNPPNPGNCSKYGPDSNKTLDIAFLWADYYKKKEYAQSLKFWRHMFNEAPGYQESVHITGIKMFQDLIEQETDSVKRELLIDTLLMIYDKRIECFGNEGYLLGRKGYELMKYRGKNYDQIRTLFARSIELQGAQTEYFLLYPYAKLMAYEYRKDNITLEEILEVYFTIADIVDKNKGGEYEANYTRAMESIVDYFKQINVLNCETMRDYYAEMYRNSPDDPEVWKKAKIGLEGCSTCDTVFQGMNKKLLEIEPSSELAARIADCEIKIGKTSEALKYYDKALELAEDKERKATLAYAVAVLLFREQGNYPQARQYAYKAIENKPNWGDPYILIGKMYASSGAECKKEKPLNGYAVSWVAIDKFEKAKSVDPSVANEANKLIATYSDYFPTLDVVFNMEYREGSSYTIGCWINETTTVRLKAKE